MTRKITIIGAGSVGSTIAYTLSTENIASELVMIDINKKKADGEVMDILQGTSFRDPISIKSGDYEDARDSNIVIITSGQARKPGMTRLELTQTNVDIIKDIAPKIAAVAPNAYYIIVSNPVDIITYVFNKISGIPEHQIIGSGTLLDTARLRYCLSEVFNIARTNVHAYVFGEHGDSAFVPWSCAQISGVHIDEYVSTLKKTDPGFDKILDHEEVTKYVLTSGAEVIADKGATFYAVSVSVCRICSVLCSASESIITVSSMMHGEYGVEDVCLSMLTRVGPEGIKGRLPVRLTHEEVIKFQNSAGKLRSIIDQIHL